MGSELVSRLGTEVERGPRKGVGVGGGLRGVDAGGPMVAPSIPASLSIRVVPASVSIAWPQDEQNLAPAETLVPHIAQNMRGGNSIIGSRYAANPRESHHEIRSTWTAVP